MTKMTIALCLCLLGFATPLAVAQTPSQAGYGETNVLPQTPAAPAPDVPSNTPAAPAPNVPSNAPAPAPHVLPDTPAAATSRSAPATPSAGAPAAAVAQPPVATRGDRLPFTGMDVAAIVLAGLVLVAAGFGLRKATSRPAA